MTRLEAHRVFFADLITAAVGVQNSSLTAAFASVRRESFLGPGPWRVFVGAGYITTPSADPAFLYQDVAIAISEQKKVNNGQPMLHAISMAALDPKPGETAIHIGAGTGYYTAVLSNLVGPTGQVFAYEIDAEIAGRATANLASIPNVSINARSGAEAPLPACDLCYVNAGATMPLDIWLDALWPGGRLLFPLTPDGPNGTPGAGGMLLVTRKGTDVFDARFVMPVMFIPCAGARDEESAEALANAFQRGDMNNVRSLHRNSFPDETCWFAGKGWWLSTAPNP